MISKHFGEGVPWEIVFAIVVRKEQRVQKKRNDVTKS